MPRVSRVASASVVAAAIVASCTSNYMLQTDSVTLGITSGSGTCGSDGVLQLLTISGTVSGSGGGNANVIPLAGLTITLSSSTSGMSFNPNSTTTDNGGSANVSLLVPYGSGTIVTASSAGGGYATFASSARALYLGAHAGGLIIQGPGAFITITASATVPSDCLGSGSGSGIGGVPIVFGGSGLSFVPSSVVTDGSGNASASAFVQFNAMPAIATISGGGSATIVPLSAPALTITPTPVPSFQAGGVLVTTSVMVTAGSASTPVGGVAVAFATNSQSAPFSPAMAVTDGSGGSASSQVFVPYGVTDVIATFTVDGYTSAKLLTAIPASITVPPLGIGSNATVGSGSGVVYPVVAIVKDGSGSVVAGVPVTFTQVGGGNNSFTPNPSVTDGNGSALSYVFVANLSTGGGHLVGVASVGSAIGSGSALSYEFSN